MEIFTGQKFLQVELVIVIARGQGFMAVNRPESEGGLRRHKSLATVL